MKKLIKIAVVAAALSAAFVTPLIINPPVF
jgi:hypothetical protein